VVLEAQSNKTAHHQRISLKELLLTTVEQQAKQTLLLFDGHNFLFRYFWGMPRTFITSEGQLVHGAYGFIASVLKHIRQLRPAQAIVCFDSQTQSDRSDIVATYKSNRVKAFEIDSVDNPFSQMKFVRASLDHLRLPWIEKPSVEADDLIGSYASVAVKRGMSVIIASCDQDFMQLVTEDISVFIKWGDRETTYTPEKVKEKFDIAPSQFVDFRALTGDTSDNINGVPGIGPKTAASLLRCYTNLENIYQNLGNLKPALLKKLEDYRHTVFLNKRIIEIHTDLLIDDSLITPPAKFPYAEMSAKQVFANIGLLA